jgi:hypothetical protein
MKISKNVKIKDILAVLNKLSNEQIKEFVTNSTRPYHVPEKSIVYDVVKQIYGEYTISSMLIVKAYLSEVLISRLPPAE